MNSLRSTRKRQRHSESDEGVYYARSLARSLVLQANTLENPLEYFQLDRNLVVGHIKLEVQGDKASELPLETLLWCYQIVEKHTRSDYERAGLWSSSGKKAELKSEAARYLLVRQKSTRNLVGFVHYRFTLEDNEHVVYIYEIHIIEGYRRLGIGMWMMELVQTIGRLTNMRKVMLTVFKSNKQALRFYKEKLGFSLDPSSPELCGDNDCKYEILCKPLVCHSEDSFGRNGVMKSKLFRLQ
eukprot:jgi/Galph1/1628/GphlegSOOS_G307.1